MSINYLNILLTTIENKYMVRKSCEEKKNFREYVKREFEKYGYQVREDEGKYKIFKYVNFETENEEFEYVITAHYDTPNQQEILSLLEYASRMNVLSKILLERPKLGKLNMLGNYVIFFALILLPIYILLQLGYEVIALIIMIYLIFSTLTSLFKSNKNNYNDNTSGVIAVLDMAKQLQENEKSHRVKFVLFDSEEKGCIGSNGLYKDRNEDFKDKVLINLDCIGVGDTAVISYLNQDDLKDNFISKLINDLEAQFNNKHNMKCKKFYKCASTDYKSFKNAKSISLALYEEKLNTYILPNYHRRKDKEIDINKIDTLVSVIVSNII